MTIVDFVMFPVVGGVEYPYRRSTSRKRRELTNVFAVRCLAAPLELGCC